MPDTGRTRISEPETQAAVVGTLAAPPAVPAGLAGARGRATVKGIGLAALGFALFVAVDSLAKLLSAGYPLHQIVFANGVIGLIPLAVLVGLGGGSQRLRTRRLGQHLLRGLFGLATAYSAFFAYARMPLAEAYAIIFAGPLLVTALSVPLLGEVVGWRRWLAISVGFLGVLIMLRPGSGIVSIGALGALSAAVFYALSVTMVRRMAHGESSASFVFYGLGTGVVICGVLLLWDAQPPASADLPLFAAAGLITGCGLICLITAYRIAPVAVVAPFHYTQIVWGVLVGYLVWGDLPHEAAIAGGGLVVASGLYVLHREAVSR